MKLFVEVTIEGAGIVPFSEPRSLVFRVTAVAASDTRDPDNVDPWDMSVDEAGVSGAEYAEGPS